MRAVSPTGNTVGPEGPAQALRLFRDGADPPETVSRAGETSWPRRIDHIPPRPLTRGPGKEQVCVRLRAARASNKEAGRSESKAGFHTLG